MEVILRILRIRYEHRPLIHFMFLSQGGSSLDEAEVSDQEKVKKEVVSSVLALHGHGVVHKDVRRANVLWDGKRVTLIDFGQAELVEPPRRALDPVIPNKRPGARRVRPARRAANRKGGRT